LLNTKLREFRELCDLSQQQVAEQLNIDRSTYSYYESGRTEPSIDNLKRLARMFGVSMLDLLEISEPSRSVVNDSASSDEYQRLDETVGAKVGDLTRQEQRLIMSFRLLTASQRNDVLLAMCANANPEKK